MRLSEQEFRPRVSRRSFLDAFLVRMWDKIRLDRLLVDRGFRNLLFALLSIKYPRIKGAMLNVGVRVGDEIGYSCGTEY